MTSIIKHYKKLQSPCRVKFLEELISLLLSPLLLSVLRHVDSFVELTSLPAWEFLCASP